MSARSSSHAHHFTVLLYFSNRCIYHYPNLHSSFVENSACPGALHTAGHLVYATWLKLTGKARNPLPHLKLTFPWRARLRDVYQKVVRARCTSSSNRRPMCQHVSEAHTPQITCPARSMTIATLPFTSSPFDLIVAIRVPYSDK